MNKFRDLLYDKNDIVVALVIILVAALIIVWRIDAIIGFPQTIIAAEEDGKGQSLPTKYSATKGTEGVDDGIRTPGSAAKDDGEKDGQKPSGYSVYINYGDSVNTVAGYLVDLGFFDTKEGCIAAINDAGVAQKLQVGTHVIPRDATPEEAIKTLTTSPGA